MRKPIPTPKKKKNTSNYIENNGDTYLFLAPNTLNVRALSSGVIFGQFAILDNVCTSTEQISNVIKDELRKKE